MEKLPHFVSKEVKNMPGILDSLFRLVPVEDTATQASEEDTKGHETQMQMETVAQNSENVSDSEDTQDSFASQMGAINDKMAELEKLIETHTKQINAFAVHGATGSGNVEETNIQKAKPENYVPLREMDFVSKEIKTYD